jgi:hypothetical protein
MRTLLFCTSVARGANERGDPVDTRIQKWIDHHAAIPWPCSMMYAVFVDGDAAPPVWPSSRPAWDRWGAFHHLNLFPHLGRPGHLAYPGWWRSFIYALRWARVVGAERIWHVESDFFIASERMVQRMDAERSGWSAFWCPHYGFAESAIEIIPNDRYEVFGRVSDRAATDQFRFYDGQHAEACLPFDRVIQDMVGDRYGEDDRDPATIPDLDFYGQARETTRFLFRVKEEAKA